jgi:hypothetical protein
LSEWIDDARMRRSGSWSVPVEGDDCAGGALRLVEAIEGDALAVDDGRLWIVQRALTPCRWRSLTVAGVAGQAAVVLDAWRAGCRPAEIELARPLEGTTTYRPVGND